DRVTMPDIDVDFEDDRRDEVINYVSSKYGSDHVAQIITFGTMLARAAIRDVGRVLGHSYGEVDRIAKAIPNQLGIKLDEALETSPELKGMVEGDPAVKRITDFARQLEGVARNASTHAAGVVISREPLTELMPLQKATNSDALMTQYEMHGIEALGLLKFDFLGLSNLTILRQAVDLVRQERSIDIDLDAIPLDDRTTFELLASGETTGVFQLESAGMRRYIRDLQPTSVYDLAAMVALYRPGPMDNIPAYIRRKHGQENVSYLHPLLEPYLAKTYGIFVYQEDIMSAAIALGGFTGPEADTLGYAIRKKKSSVLRAQKEKFVTQAAERGVDARVIDQVFAAFQPFERYGFNKAHATCYGLIAYQTAYLKANYTVEYMTAVLTAFRSNEEKVAAAVAECRRMGIEVLTPDIHRSDVEFTVEGPAIRFGLLAVKNVGQSAIESIVSARKDGGPFRSLADLCSRVDLRLVNRKVLEALTKVGALNALGHPAQVLLGLDDAIAAGQAAQRDRITGQTSLFDMGADDASAMERPLPQTTEVPVPERLRWEKELLGLYLSAHPMGEVAEQVGDFVTAYSSDLKDESLDGQRVVIGGIVTGFRTVITKTRSTMGVATLEDLQGTIEVVVFPRLYETTAGTWTEGTILLVAGRIDHRGEEVSLLADLVTDWDGAVARGQESFAREVAAGDRGRGPRRGGGSNGGPGGRPPVPVGPGPSMPDRTLVGAAVAAAGGGGIDLAAVAINAESAAMPNGHGPAIGPDEIRSGVPRVSPLRADAQAGRALPAIAPAEPISTYAEPEGLSTAHEESDEPALPDEARARAASESAAPTSQIESRPDQILHVRFGGATTDRLVVAMETFKTLLRERPGGTRVVLHLPAPTGGGSLPMELSRKVAYDAELLAEVRRRLGDGLVELRLGG
ncbi:MAG TPA: DNA polymerase III subunit alpha, partial [Candidatus Limnocylindrales bacterium]|nr:DNA polymerase III subunit alpha [Candidatus Limnocylindrales bacterium]